MQTVDALSPAQLQAWADTGFLILAGFYSEQQIADLDAVTDWVWREKPRSVVVDSTEDSVRFRLCEVESGRAGNRLKLNDLYLLSDTVRRTALDERMTPILAQLLNDDPVLINTLTIDLGTTQGSHVDALFMTPPTDDALVATWIAIEDVALDAGPLFYYPGSHLLPPFRFSTGLQRCVDAEFPNWSEAASRGISERGLDREIFLAKKGDVLIWHSRLLHGGSPIINPELTRKSLVNHFFTKHDCINLDMAIRKVGERGYWLNRPPQPAAEVGTSIDVRTTVHAKGAFRRQSRRLGANLDYVVMLPSGLHVAGGGEVRLGAGESALLRGWALDLEQRRPVRDLLAVLADGTAISGRYGLGRHDVVKVLGDGLASGCGFLIDVPASVLQPGPNRVELCAVADDEGALQPTNVSLVIEAT